MSMSTDGLFFYGVAFWDENQEQPKGLVGDTVMDPWDLKEAIEVRLGKDSAIEPVMYCCDSDPMMALAIKMTVKTAARGELEVVDVDRFKMVDLDNWFVKLQKAHELLGVEMSGKPGWFVSSWADL